MTETTARADILARLRQRPTSTATPAPPDYSVLDRHRWNREDRIERFTALLTSVHGEVIRTSRAQLVQRVLDRLSRGSIRTLLLGRDSPLADELAADRPDDLTLRVYDRPIDDWRDDLFHRVDAGLTSTLGGIAETGSLMLWPTPREPRLLSLVPPVHLAVLEADRLYDTWLDALRDQGWADRMPTNALLVSGPSKTADIEQTLVFGAHGPRELIVFLVDDAGKLS